MTEAQLLILLRKYRDILQSAIAEAQDQVHPEHIVREEREKPLVMFARESRTYIHTSYPTLYPIEEVRDLIEADIEALEAALKGPKQ